jgi:hypothetical protein
VKRTNHGRFRSDQAPSPSSELSGNLQAQPDDGFEPRRFDLDFPLIQSEYRQAGQSAPNRERC